MGDRRSKQITKLLRSRTSGSVRRTNLPNPNDGFSLQFVIGPEIPSHPTIRNICKCNLPEKDCKCPRTLHTSGKIFKPGTGGACYRKHINNKR